MFTAVRTDLETYQLVKAIAEREERTQGAVIKRAIELYLHEYTERADHEPIVMRANGDAGAGVQHAGR